MHETGRRDEHMTLDQGRLLRWHVQNSIAHRRIQLNLRPRISFINDQDAVTSFAMPVCELSVWSVGNTIIGSKRHSCSPHGYLSLRR